MNPLVSVIIPVWNREDVVKRAIQSVFSQTYENWELILIDDGSTDSTFASLIEMKQNFDKLPKKGYGKIENGQLEQICIKKLDKNSGVSVARNFGISMARGEWVAFLDSDDEWFPDKLRKQVSFHLENPKYQLSQTREKWNKKGNFISVPFAFQKRKEGIWEQSLELCAVTPSSCFIKKEFLANGNLFDEKLKCCEDYDLWLRILWEGYEIPCLDEDLLIRYGGNADQLSSRFSAIERFRMYSQLKLLKSHWNGNGKSEKLESLLGSARKRIEILMEGRKKRGLELGWLEDLQDFFLQYPVLIPKDDWENNLLNEDLFP